MDEGDPQHRGTGKLQELLDREARAPRGIPDPPVHVHGRARESWLFLRDQLAAMDLDRTPDAITLEGVCAAYARAVEADEAIARDGLLIPDIRLTKDGPVEMGLRKHPAVDIAFRAWNQVRQFALEFGLTPVSRGRLAVDKAPSDGIPDLAELLAGPRPKRDNTLQ